MKKAPVLLFAMLAKDLGFIEAAQKGFPHCETLRRVAPDRGQQELVEFEFEPQFSRPRSSCKTVAT